VKFTLAVTYNVSFGVVSHEVYPCSNLKRLIWYCVLWSLLLQLPKTYHMWSCNFCARSPNYEKGQLISSCLSVRPPPTRILKKFSFGVFFGNLSRKLESDSNPTRITGTLREDVSTFMRIFRWILLIMRNISDKICGENQNICSVTFSPKSCHLWDNVENTEQPDRPQMTIWPMRVTWRIPKTTNIYSE